MAIPAEIHGQKYISLGTFRKNGAVVRTPVWFAESDGKLVFMTRNDMWKYKRIRNNPRVIVASCNMKGKITGPDFNGTARVLPPSEWARAKGSHQSQILAGAAAVLEQEERVPRNRVFGLAVRKSSLSKAVHDTSICDRNHTARQVQPLRFFTRSNLRLLAGDC